MKRLICCFVILFLSVFSIPAEAKSIVQIIPNDSKIEFDEGILSNSDPSQLLSQSSFEKIWEILIESVREYLPGFTNRLVGTFSFVFFAVVLERASVMKSGQSYQFIVSCLMSAILTLYLVGSFSNAINVIEKNLETIRVFCDASIPIMTALLIQGGKGFASSFYSYSISLCGVVINSLCDKVCFPLIKMLIAVGCLGNVWNDIDLSAVTELIQKFIKWLIGIVFSVFTAALSMQKIITKSADTTFQKVLKSAAGGIPYMGSVLSKGIDGAFALSGSTQSISSIVGIMVILSIFVGPMVMLGLECLAIYISLSAARLFGQKDCILILKIMHKAYLLVLGLFLVSVLMCVICFLMMCLGAN